MNWDDEFDFVSIGSGIGGLVGAIVAHAHGLSTIVLEKADKIGGVTAYGHGLLWVPGSRVTAAAGISDSTEAGYEYLHRNSIGFADDGMLRRFVETAPLALAFLADHAAVPWAVVPEAGDYLWPSSGGSVAEGRIITVAPFPVDGLGPWGARALRSPHMPPNPAAIGDGVLLHGPALTGYLIKAVLERSIPIRTQTRVRQLILADGRVVGIEADHAGTTVRVRARKGVLIAVGGYDWDPRLMQHHEHHQTPGHSASPPSVTGDHLVFAGMIGAATAKVPPMPRLGYHIPGEMHEGVLLWHLANLELGHPHSILVNRSGRRFADESYHIAIGSDLLRVDLITQSVPNYPCWMVTDQRWWDGYSLGSIPPGSAVPADVAVRSQSLGGLAQLVGIDPAGLATEVARFNGHVAGGHDADFGRGEKAWSNHASRMTLTQRGADLSGNAAPPLNPNLGSLEVPPFYAVSMEVTASSISSTGLVADRDARVQDHRGMPIAGLYVAGNSMASLDIGAAHQSGVSNSRGMSFAYLAALHAANVV